VPGYALCNTDYGIDWIIQKPMILKIDNKGAVGLANNWSIGGQTCHIEICQYFVQELKEDGIIYT
jgi:hypothetical protein